MHTGKNLLEVGSHASLQRAPYLDLPAEISWPAAATGDGGSDRNPADQAGLYEYWRILSIHKWTVALITMAGLFLGVALTLLLKPVYRAKTAIEVVNINQDFLFYKQTSPLTESDNNSDTSDLQTQARILSGDTLLERVITKLAVGPDVPGRRILLEKAAKSLKIRAVARTRVIEASVDSVDRKLAMDFANTLVAEFVDENLDARWRATEKTSEWLSKELESARTKLQRSEDALQNYARQSAILISADNTNVTEEKLRQVQQELSAATAERIARQSRFELIRNASVDTLPDIANSKDLADMNAKIVDLQRQAADLSTTYTPEYTKVMRIDAQIRTLQEAFAHQKENILSRIQSDYTEALRREKLLQDAFENQTREVTGQAAKGIQYNVLKREVQSNQQMYDNMLQLLKESRVATAMRASNVRIIEPAVLPLRPASPDIRINAGAGLIFGLIGSVLFTVMRKRADRTVQDPGDVRLWLNVPELGVVPSVKKSEALLRLLPAIGPVALAPSSLGISVIRERVTERRSVLTEVFRTIATSLFFSAVGTSSKVVVVTSAGPAEGKTTVITNLARALAEIHKTVLLVDADLRRPSVHKLVNLDQKLGLSDLLSQPTTLAGNLAEAIRTTSIPGLSVITAGMAVGDVGSLLHSPAMASLLSKVRGSFDVILIDTPPLLQISDARVVARLADAAILVARAEQTSRESLIAATDQLQQDRIRVLGAILNGWNPDKSVRGFYGYKDHSYYQVYERYVEAR